MSGLISLKDVSVDFKIKNKLFGKKDRLSAVDSVTFSINKGESFGLVGESGCGKTTLANAILGFIKPDKGTILYDGHDISALKPGERKELASRMQLIFQDPYSSLNPRMPVWRLIGEPLIIAGERDYNKVKQAAVKMLKLVGLSEDDLERLPTDFSGGQRQRIVIARSLILNPEFVVCDEPLSALDVSIHAQICNLLLDLKEQLNLTYLFISHNLAVVKHMTDRMAVMYLGQIVEIGETKMVFKNPAHPYTQALMSAIMDVHVDRQRERIILRGDVASPINPIPGCRFAGRCHLKDGKCDGATELIKIEEGHYASCSRSFEGFGRE